MTIANPIYDAVFKYLMEDERIARTMLSALLKEDIIKVEMRPHEYTNGQRELLSVFRIDFGATIRKPDGSEEMILIELQKNWLPTETLRFRQYVGTQYQDPRNIVQESADRHALPMVTVYLLGHTLGEIEEPVVYVRHSSYDYDGNIVTRGIPNAFIESLIHNSIIVQIPRLRSHVSRSVSGHLSSRNRLEQVLGVFDQSLADKKNQHTLTLDDRLYDQSDEEMQRILYRLTAAAADYEMRQDMNVEDEYYSIIKEQESKLYYRERELAEANAQLAEIGGQLAETSSQLAEKEGQLAEKEGQLAEKEGQLAEKEGQLAETSSQLQASVRLLLQVGQTTEMVAQTLNISIDDVKRLAGHTVRE